MLNAKTILLSVLGLGACAADENRSAVEKPTDAKSDSASKVCVALGEPETCDPCELAGWYGDNECDTFCTNPDPDCGASDVAAFLARPDLATGFGEKGVFAPSSNSTSYRNAFVATELTQATADAWAAAMAPMVGAGLAVHMTFPTDYRVGLAWSSVTVPVARSANADGSCSEFVSPNMALSTAAVNVFRWGGATATPVACSLGGSITVTVANSQVELEALVEFNDGTSWQRTLRAPY